MTPSKSKTIFLYFDNSDSFVSWPKESTTSDPNGYIIYSVTSSEAINWLGSEDNLNEDIKFIDKKLEFGK